MRVVFLFFAFAIAVVSFAQGVDPKNVDVNALSDTEIQKLISEMDKRGMSEGEAIALARARGMSELQISSLKKRIEEVKMGGGDSSSEEVASVLTDEILNEDLSIKDSVYQDVGVFGYKFFNSKELSFEPGINSAVSPSYLVGSGDQIEIDIWGASQQSYILNVDRNGNINIPNIGPIAVGGLTLELAEKKIRNKLVLIYRDLEASSPRTFASVNLGQIKSIKINVIGDVYAPGTYTLSGASTAFNALYLAGGPDEKGSFRDIRIIRDGKEVTRLDVYDYLVNGNSEINVSLRDGDIIMVKPYIKRVALEGEVRREGIFEAKEGESVEDIISFAGGFTEDAYTHRLQMYRKTGRDLVFKDVYKNDFKETLINNGDRILVGMINDRYQNLVNINGAVYRPGDYELTEGLTLSELIKKAEGLMEDASLERGIITRVKEDFSLQSIAFNVKDVVTGKSDINLQKDDQVNIASIHDLREERMVHVYGHVQNEGEYNYKEGMSITDLIYEAGGFLESASDSYIEVSRRLSILEGSEVTDKLSHVFKMNVPRNLELENSKADFVLQPFDQVFIRKLPGFNSSRIVKVSGEVAYAGTYALQSKSERLSDLIKRTGGITADAYPAGAMLTRRLKISEKQKRLRAELLERDSTLEFTDLDFDIIGINLDKAINNPGSKEDIFLMNGDEIFVPREMQTVKLSGEVLNPISSNFIKGKRLKSYIWEGGGFGLLAKRGKVYVIYPNGSTSGTKNYVFFKKYPRISPGSEIVVPARPYREPLPASSWIAMASAMASVAVVISNINF